jgi:seryl-tRNA synthetase
MSKEDIIQEAKDAYQKVFKDQEKRNSQDEENEVIFNQTELKKEIQEMKEKEEHKHKTLEALRHCIHEKAEESYEKTFHENTNKHIPSHQKMDTQEMYGQLQSEKEHLTKMVKEMKDKELSKHK